MRNPFRKQRPFEKAVAVEVATFGRRVAQWTIKAQTYRYDDVELERTYSYEIDRATARIVAVYRQDDRRVDTSVVLCDLETRGPQSCVMSYCQRPRGHDGPCAA